MHTIQIILFIIQTLGLGLFIQSAHALYTECDLKITFYNLPSIIMMLIALLAGSYLCVAHFLWYLPFGMIMAVISWIVNTYVPVGEQQPNIYRKLSSVFAALLFWHQLIAILIIIFSNKDKVNYEKL